MCLHLKQEAFSPVADVYTCTPSHEGHWCVFHVKYYTLRLIIFAVYTYVDLVLREMACVRNTQKRWEFIKEKREDLKTNFFFLSRDIVFFLFFLVKILCSFFLGRKRVFAHLSWSKASFLFILKFFFHKFPSPIAITDKRTEKIICR